MIYVMIAIIISLSAQDGERQESFEGFTSGIRANAVKGDVLYRREDGKFDLEAGHKLQEGDFIKTGSNSYAELLLQPGNYLRVGADSELQIFSDSSDKMRLKLNYGAISLEVLSKEGEDGIARYYESLSQIYELIRVLTPNAEVFITRSGIFRINATSAGRTELIVRDGEAVINGRRVKEKRNAVTSREGVTIADLNSKLEDGFDAWSRERAEELIRANRSLKQEAPWAKNRKEEDDPAVDFPEDEGQRKRNRLVVSARPGVVNFADAGVEFSRPSKEWERLTEKSQLETGDRVRTSAHSFAEISLLPDVTIRIDAKSELMFEQLSHESMSLKVLQGAAILDVARYESKEGPQISLAGASASAVIADEGNYRIDLKPNGDEITIRDGKVIFKERQVGSCRRIVSGTVSDCDKKITDNFDAWSDHRGEGKLYNGRDMISMVSHLDRLRRIRNRNTGFWFQHPGKTHYTFVPFHSPLFRSPYGGSYSTVLSPRRLLMIRPNLRDRPMAASLHQ